MTIIPLACSCLNLRFAAEIEQPPFGATPLAGTPPDPSATPEQRDLRFFGNAVPVKTLRLVPPVVGEFVHDRRAEHAGQSYVVRRCLQCGLDALAVPDSEATVALVNCAGLAIGLQAVEALRLHPAYCAAFGVVLAPALASSGLALGDDAAADAALASNLHQQVTAFLQREQLATEARLEAYRRAQHEKLVDVSNRAAMDELAIFRAAQRLRCHGAQPFPPSPVLRFSAPAPCAAAPAPVLTSESGAGVGGQVHTLPTLPTEPALDDAEDVFMFEEELSAAGTGDQPNDRDRDNDSDHASEYVDDDVDVHLAWTTDAGAQPLSAATARGVHQKPAAAAAAVAPPMILSMSLPISVPMMPAGTRRGAQDRTTAAASIRTMAMAPRVQQHDESSPQLRDDATVTRHEIFNIS